MQTEELLAIVGSWRNALDDREVLNDWKRGPARPAQPQQMRIPICYLSRPLCATAAGNFLQMLHLRTKELSVLLFTSLLFLSSLGEFQPTGCMFQ
jgi:hypothetical protein